MARGQPPPTPGGTTMSLRAAALGLLALAVAVPTLPAQPRPNRDEDFPVDAATKSAVIDGVLKALHEEYVFPDLAKQMEKAIRDRLAAKEYDGLTTAHKFGDALQEHLRAVCKDKHLSVVCSKDPIPPPPKDSKKDEPGPEELARMRRMGQVRNFGFEKVERLGGNVGYLDLRGFMQPDAAGDTAAAAMNFLHNTDALIIDLRQNGGGSPGMVALVCSYLLGSEMVHLNDIYNRREDTTKQ